jgi:Putative DNA-binding domain
VPSDTDLLALQRNFMAAIREPIYGGSRQLSSLPPRTGEVSPKFAALADGQIRSTPSLEARERLELYHRQYWFRLLDSIAEDFPVLKRLLGETSFWRLIEAYLEFVPSRSYTLRHLGQGLADFIRLNPGLAGGYPVHAAELAQLEYTLCDIFEAAALPPVPAENLAHVRLGLQPHLRLFIFHTPVDALWRLEDDAEIPAELLASPAGQPGYPVAVFRHQGRLKVHRLPAKAFSVLQAIQQTGSLAQALEPLEFTDAGVPEVSDWFQQWTELGWLCEPALPVPAGDIETEELAAPGRPVNIPVHHTP